MLKLEHLMSYNAKLAQAVEVGAGPFGHRLIVEVDGGEFEGPRLKGKFRTAACADWLTMGADFGHLDVRGTLETDDGAFIYLEYYGKIELTEGIQAALAGQGDTDYGEQYFVTSPRFQTGDPRYSWINNIVCVSEGRLRGGLVEYNVYQIANG